MKTTYKCSKCDHKAVKWQGKCPECNSWNSYVEIVTEIKSDLSKPSSLSQNTELIPESFLEVLSHLNQADAHRIHMFSAQPLNLFWGGGLVAGSYTLLAGEPGLGKSTLALQLLKSLYNQEVSQQIPLLYITAEESAFELARRSKRLEVPPQIMVLQSNNFEQIEKVLIKNKPAVVIIDSIQTLFIAGIAGSPGSVSQVSYIASQFLVLAKAHNISIILIGHVTKDGQIAGPKTLEHLVDSVLTLEPSTSSQYRTLSFSKHRFGQTTGLLLLKMEATGLQIVTDPSLALLENIETGVGVVYGVAMDKDLPLVVEIQALVSQSYKGGGFGRRESIGLKTSKLSTLIAIIEKYLHVDLQSHDIYIQLTGLPKNIQDDSLDLPVILAILSSLQNLPIQEMVKHKKGKLIFAGRATLSGNIRKSTHDELRLQTAKKLGFFMNQGVEYGLIAELKSWLM